jgi:4-diphosphocytidyl-2-C-methyl-D-erythritol kinase
MAAAAVPGLWRDAWAKVNLTLHITGRRADGYHELDSLVVFAGVGDRLEIEAADELSLDLTGGFAADLEAGARDASENLVLRAARALKSAYGVTGGARLRLEKCLPVSAGLGGGSADAAAALAGLAGLWGLEPGEAELNGLALALGADVPVCLAGRPSFVSGIGEIITAAPPLPPAWLVLANPGVPLATPAVFARWDGAFSRSLRWSDPIHEVTELAQRLAGGGNDLEAAARALVPVVGEVLDALGATGDCLMARMSGSGATCVGLYPARAQAETAAMALAERRQDWWVRAAPMLGTGAGPEKTRKTL